MMTRLINQALSRVGLALLLGRGLAPLVSATPLAAVPDEVMQMYRSLAKRDPPTALPQRATALDLKWQPGLDFDTDGCYNTPAIDAAGNLAPGLDHNWTGGSSGCRDLSDLQNNNVYSRQRCNNGWCVYLYDYYFEKDVAVQNFLDCCGHRHDWEHIAVFTQNDEAKIVAASAHGDYSVKSPSEVRWDGTHVKVVYHKDGAGTHAFRWGTAADEAIENHLGVWFRGALVSYNGFPSTAVRDKLMGADFGSAHIAINDASFKGHIDEARGSGGAPGFDSAVDVGSPGTPA